MSAFGDAYAQGFSGMGQGAGRLPMRGYNQNSLADQQRNQRMFGGAAPQRPNADGRVKDSWGMWVSPVADARTRANERVFRDESDAAKQQMANFGSYTPAAGSPFSIINRPNTTGHGQFVQTGPLNPQQQAAAANYAQKDLAQWYSRNNVEPARGTGAPQQQYEQYGNQVRQAMPAPQQGKVSHTVTSNRPAQLPVQGAYAPGAYAGYQKPFGWSDEDPGMRQRRERYDQYWNSMRNNGMLR